MGSLRWAYLSMSTLSTTPGWGLVEKRVSAKLTQLGLSLKAYKRCEAGAQRVCPGALSIWLLTSP